MNQGSEKPYIKINFDSVLLQSIDNTESFEPYKSQTTTIDTTTQTGWENLRTYHGTTNIIPSVESNIEMQYVADTKLYIDNKLSKLTAMT